MLQFQLVSEPGFSSNIIEWYTNFWACHVDIVIPQGTNIDGYVTQDEMLLGARVSGGVELRPWNYLKFTKVGRYSLSVRPQQEQQAYDFAASQIGKSYDWKTILGFAFNRNWDDPQKWICSELALAVTDAAGKPILRVDYLGAATPRDITTSMLLTPTSVPQRYIDAGAKPMT